MGAEDQGAAVAGAREAAARAAVVGSGEAAKGEGEGEVDGAVRWVRWARTAGGNPAQS